MWMERPLEIPPGFTRICEVCSQEEEVNDSGMTDCEEDAVASADDVGGAS